MVNKPYPIGWLFSGFDFEYFHVYNKAEATPHFGYVNLTTDSTDGFS